MWKEGIFRGLAMLVDVDMMVEERVVVLDVEYDYEPWNNK